MGKENPSDHRQAKRFSPNKRNSQSVGNIPSTRSDRARRRGNARISNAKRARAMWGTISKIALDNLADLTEAHGLSVTAGISNSSTVAGT